MLLVVCHYLRVNNTVLGLEATVVMDAEFSFLEARFLLCVFTLFQVVALLPVVEVGVILKHGQSVVCYPHPYCGSETRDVVL